MPYLNPSNTFLPYHSGPILQRGGLYNPRFQTGGGLFSTLGSFASNYVLPWFKRIGKVASSAATDVMKSDATKRLTEKAKQAAADGIIDATKEISKGTPIKDAISTSASKAKNTLSNALKSEVGKALKRKIEGPAQRTVKRKPNNNTKRKKQTSTFLKRSNKRKSII